MVVDWGTFTIHTNDYPHLGRSEKYHLQMANLCFGVLSHHPTAHIGTWHNLLGLEPISSSFGDWRFTN